MGVLVKISLFVSILTLAAPLWARESTKDICKAILSGHVRLRCQQSSVVSPNPNYSDSALQVFELFLKIDKGFANGPRGMVTGRAQVRLKGKTITRREEALYRTADRSMYIPLRGEALGTESLYLDFENDGSLKAVSYFRMTPWGRDQIVFGCISP